MNFVTFPIIEERPISVEGTLETWHEVFRSGLTEAALDEFSVDMSRTRRELRHAFKAETCWELDQAIQELSRGKLPNSLIPKVQKLLKDLMLLQQYENEIRDTYMQLERY